jgi:oligopeptide/dipeptide ABC transporter ATP-binding protein
MSDVLIELQGVTKRFRKRGMTGSSTGTKTVLAGDFNAVREVSFTIPKDSIFGLVGESGCGKTTLARSMLYLDPPTMGRVLFDGIDLSTLNAGALRKTRQHMQIVFQDPNGAMNPRLKVRTSLGEGVRNLGLDRGEVDRRIAEAVDSVGIPSAHLDRKPREFSGGQKQRLALARALTMKPRFLVLDEPVSNLDVSIQAQIINLLVDLKDRHALTYLFISHDLNLVAYLSDYTAVMYGGRIVEIGRTDELVKDPLHVYTRTLFLSSTRVIDRGGQPMKSGLHRDEKIDAKPIDEGCPFRSTCSLSTSRCLKVIPRFRWLQPYRGVACHAVSKRNLR